MHRLTKYHSLVDVYADTGMTGSQADGSHLWYIAKLGTRRLAMFWYEYIITLDREINLFWNKKITGATVLFLVNRYSTLFYMTYVFPVWPLSMKYEVSISLDA